MKLIDKDKIVKELERRVEAIRKAFNEPSILSVVNRTYGVDRTYANAQSDAFKSLLTFLDTIGTEDVKTWHRQSEKDIYDSFNDWDYHTFLCLMDDGSVQKFSGICAECANGTVNKHIDAIDDEYDDVDKIVYWIETPITLK